MNKLLIFLVSVLSPLLALSQGAYTPPTSFIHVSGTSELEVIPNEIYIGFTAKEYKKKNEDVLLDDIHKDVLAVIKSFNIPEENLQVENFYGSRWLSKRKIKDLVANKRYSLKITQIDIIDQLLEKLDSINIQEIELERISHSDLEQFKQQVKIQATKNAKEKATLMTEAIDQKLGKAFEILEVHKPINNYYNKNEYDRDKYYGYKSVSSFNEFSTSSKINFKTITLTYEVSVKFELL